MTWSIPNDLILLKRYSPIGTVLPEAMLCILQLHNIFVEIKAGVQVNFGAVNMTDGGVG